jgi:putative N-acetylmannosamine-6-phosphate epimerase
MFAQDGCRQFCVTVASARGNVVTGARRPYHAAMNSRERTMDELNGRMIACQILITGLIARVANTSPDPLRFLTDFRDEIRAVVKGINIAGMDNTDRVRQVAQQTVDELFSLMKPPSAD